MGVKASSFFFSSRRRHTRFDCDWSSDVCSSDLQPVPYGAALQSRVSAGEPNPLRTGISRRTGNLLGRNATDLADRKSTRLNSSHSQSSYAVFCLKKRTALGQGRQVGVERPPLDF